MKQIFLDSKQIVLLESCISQIKQMTPASVSYSFLSQFTESFIAISKIKNYDKHTVFNIIHDAVFGYNSKYKICTHQPKHQHRLTGIFK